MGNMIQKPMAAYSFSPIQLLMNLLKLFLILSPIIIYDKGFNFVKKMSNY